ncbi:MAG TPA: amino acid permease [Planctomycetaceae bacterium]|nr:amino acid permease [Planctomycetaceae bacterium]HIQ20761.1 amino acid permease [Planctomycetota bacterium]
MSQPAGEADRGDQPAATLGLWDAVSIIIGIVVGTGIFKTPQSVFANVEGPWQGIACWVLGGVLALLGALCYAELATTYPRLGGDYVYLTRAYGRQVGFLFGWAQLAVILTGSIGAMAYAFGDYAVAFWPGLESSWSVWLAVASVVALTAMNLLGVVCGKAVQNVLTVVKVVGLAGVVVAGLAWGDAAGLAVKKSTAQVGFGLAMVFVLYTYGGWNDAAFVAAEVRARHRNIPLALLLGTGGITLIYVLVNLAYLWGLGFEGLRRSSAPAAEVAQLAVGPSGGKAICLLVMLSALGAMNGLIFTGSRIYVSLGADHRLFAWLSPWDRRRGAPVRSLLIQMGVALLLILAVGTPAGQGSVDWALSQIGLGPLPWEDYYGGFNTLVAASAPTFWAFFLLTGFSLFILRAKDAGRKRPFSAPLYPLEPILFCGMCYYMLFSAVEYAKGLTLVGLVPLAAGVPLYWLSQAARRRGEH